VATWARTAGRRAGGLRRGPRIPMLQLGVPAPFQVACSCASWRSDWGHGPRRAGLALGGLGCCSLMRRWSWVTMSGGICSGRACAGFATRELCCSASSLRGMWASSLVQQGDQGEGGFTYIEGGGELRGVGLGWRFHFLPACFLLCAAVAHGRSLTTTCTLRKTNHDRLTVLHHFLLVPSNLSCPTRSNTLHR
jgi:hypothetical protein